MTANIEHCEHGVHWSGDCPRCRDPKDDPRVGWGPGEWADEVGRLQSQLAGAVEARNEAMGLLHEWMHGPLDIPHRMDLNDRTLALLDRLGAKP
jgi:hypothetical protein